MLLDSEMNWLDKLFAFLLVSTSILFVGTVLVYYHSSHVSSPGNGGIVLEGSKYYDTEEQMFRGQTFYIEFWGQTTAREYNWTYLPVDFYVMTPEQYRNFTEYNSVEAIMHVRSEHTSTYFQSEKDGQYFMVLNITAPGIDRKIVGFDYTKHGLNYNYLEPLIVASIPLTIISSYKISKRIHSRNILT